MSRYNSLYNINDNDIKILRVLIRRLDEDVNNKGDDDNVVIKRS